MERDANYVAVGAFILLVIGMAVVFLVWYSDANDGRVYDSYEIYFTGSVSGLDRGSPVRYLGVDVGRVRRMAIDRDTPSRVQVVVEIDRNAPISSATRASLNFQGVTGLLFVNLKEAPELNRMTPLPQGERFPVIQAVESPDFDVLLAGLPELLTRANQILERVGRVFSDENLQGVSQTIGNLRNATATFPQTSASVARLVTQLQETVADIQGASEGLRGITEEARPEVRNTLERLAAASESLAQASARIDRFTQSSEAQLGNFSEQGLFELQRLLRDTSAAAREFQELSRSLRENPSQILYEPPVSGVEIEP
jgi:phospholipid/cholesterol/gamma-HCH transport system substrate-binding protein